ncbi:MAG TPA: hypothetical protein VHF45_05230 [Thermoleophilaceae bacterium]|nr:hypothetical protein [Thermoleophilaceae bacterium]
MTVTGAASDARSALLGRLIDHAALFPPASMSVPEAVSEDHRARESPYGWMLARFVCPVSKLAALGEELPWAAAPGLSVVLDEDDLAPLERAVAAGAPVEAVELRLPEAAPSSAFLDDMSRRLRWTPYFELRLGERWRETVTEAVRRVADVGGRVKLRCGGQAIPSVEQVALVISACREAGSVFKATAGLHHPVRRGSEHGFLNLLAAVVLAHGENASASEIERVLAEEDPGAFVVGREGLAVHGRRATGAQIAASREELFAGFGSCSWREPVEDLRELGIL